MQTTPTMRLLLIALFGCAQGHAATNSLLFAQLNLNVTSFGEHSRFWTGALGATPIKSPDPKVAILSFPNLIIFMRENPPKGGTTGSTVDHVGFQVPNVHEIMTRILVAGYRIVTTDEAPTRSVRNGALFSSDHNLKVVFMMGPDEIKIELIENPSLKAPVFHHVHFITPQEQATQAWYSNVFGVKFTHVGSIGEGALPLAVKLLFSTSPTPVVGTRGRVIDHIGFEAKDLKEFCAGVEALGVQLDQPAKVVPAPWNSNSASLTDPSGTYIQVTEGAAFGFFRSYLE
jgi:catechol 2,3-dioxygenase-like lactoylglutathione lyase family enzyme